MDSNTLRDIVEQSIGQDNIRPSHIPHIDLYLDQILTIFEKEAGETRRCKQDKLLTKSMINNYSKEKLITPLKGKKYTREQVLQIMTIYHLKNTLAIGDIKKVMEVLTQNSASQNLLLEQQLEELEPGFPQEQTMLVADQLLARFTQPLDEGDLVQILVAFSNLSACFKRVCENIIDSCLENDAAKQ